MSPGTPVPPGSPACSAATPGPEPPPPTASRSPAAAASSSPTAAGGHRRPGDHRPGGRRPYTATGPRGSPRNVWPGTVREITTSRQPAARPGHLARGPRSRRRDHPAGRRRTRPRRRDVRVDQRQGDGGLAGHAVRERQADGPPAGVRPAHRPRRAGAPPISAGWAPGPGRRRESRGSSSSGSRRNRGMPRRLGPTTGPSPPR